MAYKKEDVIKWYNSLIKSLTEAGFDLKNPGDLMRICITNAAENENAPGRTEQADFKSSYAFIRKKVNQETGKAEAEYEKPEPVYGKEVQIDDYNNIVSDFDEAAANMAKSWDKLNELRKRKQPYKQITEEKRNFEEAESERNAARKAKRQGFNRIFSKYDKWIIQNSKLYDPEAEEDYANIEALYSKAKEGYLFIQGAGTEGYDQTQILVNDDNKAVLGPNLKDIPRKLDNYESLQSHLDNEKIASYKEKYGVVLKKPSKLPARPKEPAAVPKPGLGSWLKYIFSFGRVRTDFDNYNEYTRQKNLVDIYDRNLPNLKENTRRENEEIYRDYDKVLEQEYKDLYPENVSNVGMLAGKLLPNSYTEISVDDEDPEKNIYNTKFFDEKKLHNKQLMFELRENPKSFDKDGNRNEKESSDYWKNRAPLSKEEEEANKKLKNDKLKGLNTDFEIKKRDMIKEGSEELKENCKKDKNYILTHPWLDTDISESFAKLGKLCGKTDNPAEYGSRIFAAAVTQNQPYDMNGKFRGVDYEYTTIKSDKDIIVEKEDRIFELKNNGECLKDIDRLLTIANTPEESLSEHDRKFLSKMETIAADDNSNKRTVDSLASIISGYFDYGSDTDFVSHGIACCCQMFETLRNDPKLELFAPLSVNGSEDNSVSGIEERVFADSISNDVTRLCMGYKAQTIEMNKKMQAEKNAGTEVKEEKAVKEITVKENGI